METISLKLTQLSELISESDIQIGAVVWLNGFPYQIESYCGDYINLKETEP